MFRDKLKGILWKPRAKTSTDQLEAIVKNKFSDPKTRVIVVKKITREKNIYVIRYTWNTRVQSDTNQTCQWWRGVRWCGWSACCWRRCRSARWSRAPSPLRYPAQTLGKQNFQLFCVCVCVLLSIAFSDSFHMQVFPIFINLFIFCWVNHVKTSLRWCWSF